LASYIIWITSIVTLLILVGCSSTPKPPMAQISLDAQEDINNLRPVVIRVYELKSLATFNTTDFFSAFNNYKEILDTELLNSEEFQLSPGKKLEFERTLDIDTRYMGVIAAFRDLEHSQWRAAVVIPSKERKLKIYILLEGNKVFIQAKPKCSFFCQLWAPKPVAANVGDILEQTGRRLALA
jgi:type VI secretion system protein VasD